MSGGAPLGSNPAASAELTAKYTRLFHTYRLAVNGAHFGPNATTISGASLFQWHAPEAAPAAGQAAAAGGAPPVGIAACSGPPLLRLLAAPRLPPELAKYLQQ